MGKMYSGHSSGFIGIALAYRACIVSNEHVIPHLVQNFPKEATTKK